jgi:PIN domain nuclease of toxin-antitoxin system
VILLDTNALIWLEQGHRRARPLQRGRQRLYISPASLMELQMLHEVGRIALDAGGLEAIVADDRWLLDDPPASRWFLRATEEGWTRDPFDRLIAAHARLRGWTLASGDRQILDHLGSHTLAL